jgi:hypothetical protein
MNKRRTIGGRKSLFSYGNTRLSPLNGGSTSFKRIDLTMIMTRGLLIVFILYVFTVIQFQSLSSTAAKEMSNQKTPTVLSSEPATNVANVAADADLTTFTNLQPMKRKDYCDFRKYPLRRYYGLPIEQPSQPDFLRNAEYIYGRLPMMLLPKSNMDPQKLCVDQSEWYPPPNENSDKLPFADGTNPSILKLANNPRIDPSIRNMFPPQAQYLATICMTNSQCSWNETPQEQQDYRLSSTTQNKPSTVRTVLLILNDNFDTLKEATIYTVMDAPFGRKRQRAKRREDGIYPEAMLALDDARLFTYQGQIWVSYREGKLFGYDHQVLNQVHFDRNGNDLKVRLLAADTETFCCGRNMALIDNVHTNKLQALTWVDPVTVDDVIMTKPQHRMPDQGKLSSHSDHRRRLGERRDQTKKSHFHGTNGFMVYLPHNNEYLGIGHFHRPPGREANDYARFGHHYTHAFFTISDMPPFHLKRLSQELVLPSQEYKNDAEIIQFWSGLELLDDNTLTVAYGINDCEGAATTLDLATVEDLLLEVDKGKEVVDLMMPLSA